MSGIEEFNEEIVESIQQAVEALAKENPVVIPGFVLGQSMAQEAIMENNKPLYDAATTVLWFLGILSITEEGICSQEDAMKWSDWGFPIAVEQYEATVSAIINEEIGEI